MQSSQRHVPLQVISVGLTQEDVADLIEDTQGVCTCSTRCKPVPTSTIPRTVNQSEVEGLYRRFRQLDKARKARIIDTRCTCVPTPQQGFLTAAELENIPELSINPLAKRVSHLYEGANFKVPFFLIWLVCCTSNLNAGVFAPVGCI